MSSSGRIDGVLRRAVEEAEVPGVVAIAATDTTAGGVFYQGAFGVRQLGTAAPMTLDTVFRIASMTKTVTAVAAMQLVEAGRLSLDAPVPDIDPALGSPQVLEGFDGAGMPRLRPAARPITLRRLLTHTAGFGYETWNADIARYVATTGTPSTGTGRLAALALPLVFDPGERWEYGINIDWVGRLVEAASGEPLDRYFREHIFAPLGMNDTAFAPDPGQRRRQATVHQRDRTGALLPQILDPPANPEFHAGGGGLFSTAPDYLAFLSMLLHEGEGGGVRILRPETVRLIGENQIGDLDAGIMKTTNPARSNDVDFFPGMPVRWGLGSMLTLRPGPDGRSANSLTWAGVFNTYFWLDPAKRVAAAILTQLLPFADRRVLDLYRAFEREVYAAL